MSRIVALAFALCFLPGAVSFAAAVAAPDDTLTPGAIRIESARHLTSATVREVARRYRVTGGHDPSCGKVCELDHRIPFGCHGATLPDNLSFQTYGMWQKKDRLEHWAERQVKLRRLTIAECQVMFAAPNDWRKRYRVVFGEAP